MLVRLLQTFDRFELDASAQPPETIPPASWKDVPGRQSIERCWPKAHLTLYAHVSRFLLTSVHYITNSMKGRHVDPDARGSSYVTRLTNKFRNYITVKLCEFYGCQKHY